MTLLELLVIALAAYRLAILLTIENGPGDVALKLRTMSGLPLPGYPAAGELSVLARLLECTWCCSFWTAVIFYGIAQVWMPVVEIYACAGAALFLVRWRE